MPRTSIAIAALAGLAVLGSAAALPFTHFAPTTDGDLTINAADPPVAVLLKALMGKDCTTTENILDDSFVWWGTDATATTNDAPLVKGATKKQLVAMACGTAPPGAQMVMSDPSTWRATGLQGMMSMAYTSTIVYAGPPLSGSSVNCTAMCGDTFVARVNGSGKITSILNTWDQVQYLTSANRCAGKPVPVPSQSSSTDFGEQSLGVIQMFLNGQCDAMGNFEAANLTKWQTGQPKITKAMDIANCKQFFSGFSMWYIIGSQLTSSLEFGDSWMGAGVFGITVTDPTTKAPCSIFSE